MKTSRFTESQFISILKQADADIPVKDICPQAAMKDLIEKMIGPTCKREAVRYLVQVHPRPVRRSSACVGLSEGAWYRPIQDWKVRDVEVISELSQLVQKHQSRGFWKFRKHL